MSMFPPVPEPATELARYRILSPKCGLRVSPLQLGAMSIGSAWSQAMGSMDKENSFKLLDAFYESGGNFIDTACNYQEEESEKWLGEWMAQKGNRDEMVIATKYTTSYKGFGRSNIQVNYCGNHRKNMHKTLEDSLKKLQTSYVDIFYLHWWEHTTSIEEVMQGLNDLVRSGKVHYLGISDAPAWVVSKANMYARCHGFAEFVIYQGKWNVMDRDMERDIIPMCIAEGLAIAPWSALGGGKFQIAKAVEERKKSGEGLRKFFGEEQTEQQVKISRALEKVAGEHGIESITAIALAYVMQKTPYVFPIVGGRKIEHLKDNIGALSINLTEEQIKELESATEFDLGFPHNFVGAPRELGGEINFLMASTGHYSMTKGVRPIPAVAKK